MTRPSLLAALAAALALISSQAAGAWLNPCATARLVAMWQRQGLWRTHAIYDPPKSRWGHRVRLLGDIHAKPQGYRIYFDENSAPEGTHHGHHDVIVTTLNDRFLGLYDVGLARPVAKQGSLVLFNSSKKWGDRIRFGPKGPPKQIYIDGELPDFNTPQEVAKYTAPNPVGPLEPRVQVSAYCHRR